MIDIFLMGQILFAQPQKKEQKERKEKKWGCCAILFLNWFTLAHALGFPLCICVYTFKCGLLFGLQSFLFSSFVPLLGVFPFIFIYLFLS
jgi:hypothetical protein